MTQTSLGAQLAPHLPYVRRYARALTGNQVAGDRIVRATLEAIVAAPEEFPRDVTPRIGLYSLFETLWQASHDAGGDDALAAAASNTDLAVQSRLSAITPVSRRALLLTTMEGFTHAEAAHLLHVEEDEVADLVKVALSDIGGQTPARVLIIEDEPMIAMDIQDIVEDAGHTVTGIASTRDEAVRLFGETPPDLVLADIQLADNSSGIEAVNDMWADRPVPVIFITAFPERLLTGEKPEPAFLITKPFQREAVQVAMAQALFFHGPEQS
jgi:CheY-like chemotaxis protein/DNA-directed RNA polymerase specialized sigma24 family protein